MNANNLDKYTYSQIEEIRNSLNNGGVVPLLNSKTEALQVFALEVLNAWYANLALEQTEYQVGMAVAGVAFIFQVFFLKFFPTFSWLGYAYRISLDTEPMVLFTVFAKLGIELYHQVQMGHYPNRDFSFDDFLVAGATIVLLLVNG